MLQRVTGFCAKMRHIHDGSGIVGAQVKHFAGRQSKQSFARLQHGQRAQKAGGIEIMNCHTL